MQDWLSRLWSQHGEYYLGEWHYHPHGAPKPSSIDVDGMKSIAESEQYSCPEPILLIVGGNPHGEWSANMFVWIKRSGLTELLVDPGP